MDNTSIQNLKPGTIVNSGKNIYTIKSVLGNGAFGITYYATGLIRIGSIGFEVPFAIKEHFMQSCFRDKNGTRVLCTPGSKDDVDLSRKDFLTEANRLQQLCNKTRYIVKVNETFEANGTAYYVMEYLSGGILKANSKQQAICYMLQLSEAVRVLHDNKVLHLDIKPSNIIFKVDEDLSEPYPGLLDFGITKHFDEKGRPTTTPRSKGASSGYAPIEQYDDVTSFSPAIDIYSMGATLFYLLTGKNPPSAFKLCYDNKSICDDLSQARCEEFIPFITKAMASNHKDRPCNVKEFEEALRSVELNGKEKLSDNGTQKVSTITLPSTHIPTKPLFKHIYKFKGSLEHINNLDIEERLQSIIVAQNTFSEKFGIIDNQNNIIIPFEYLSIGFFKEIPEGRGTNFTFGWRLVAPFQKNQKNESYQGGLEITSNGSIIETVFDYADSTQTYFPSEPRTHGIIHKQTFKVNGENTTIYIQQIPWGHFGITDTEENVIAPFIYDSIEPFSEYCTIPGPGIPKMFLGAKYTIGNNVGFFKITESGILVDYKRFSIETYKNLSTLT